MSNPSVSKFTDPILDLCIRVDAAITKYDIENIMREFDRINSKLSTGEISRLGGLLEFFYSEVKRKEQSVN